MSDPSANIKFKGNIEITRAHAPGIYDAVTELCKKAGVEMPKIFLLDGSGTGNAYHQFTMNHIAAASEPARKHLLLG
ncbi:MAG: hypothetical protein J0M34_02910 [Alphaproteobacteria bacterium]|nr:hypothetical protein [Alphaproteobacteria bacterium]